MYKHIILVVALLIIVAVQTVFCADKSSKDQPVAALARELGKKGWIVYSSRSSNGSWDLFLSRPDGSRRKNITNTKDYQEGGARFSPDGKKMLYRRTKAGTVIGHDKWGFQGQLIIADADGTNPVVYGEERAFPWASWSADSKHIACLNPKGIEIVELATKIVIRKLPRKGIYQQIFWSPDGKWFCGVANTHGMWTVVRMNCETGELNSVREFQNCTPDWFGNSKQMIFSSRPAKQTENKGQGWTQLWMADGDGKDHKLLYGEDGFHIYGGAMSPDGKYVLFTKCPVDGGGSETNGAPIYIARFADTPIITGKSTELRKLHPDTKDGPVFSFGNGWEPHWTYAKIGEEK